MDLCERYRDELELLQYNVSKIQAYFSTRVSFANAWRNLASDKEDRVIREIFGEMAVKTVYIYLPSKQNKWKTPCIR